MADEAQIRLNYKGVSEILKNSPEFAALANATARQIAAQIGPDAVVTEYTSDRQAASVGVPDYRQARDGALTRAAAAVGLTVRAKA
ncbi:hypothetical protein ACHIPZ_13845 [Antrihabitans sp. NCIMB 15449]|jgi:hypothetical protein|uniref:Uncharacterized protein n=1 Tax=Antrihabitans spumae TaxID=3373370 RepID=A0ABW7JQ24_9NOCA